MVRGRPFKKGVSGNPKGKPPMAPEVRELRIRSRAAVEKVVLTFLNKTQNELKDIIASSQSNSIEKLAAMVIAKGISNGDYSCMTFLSDFTFGAKPKESKVTLEADVSVDFKDKEKAKALLKEIQDEV